MKKEFLSILALFAFGFVNAQFVKLGIKGGANFATLTGDIEEASMKIGFHAGGFAEFRVTETFFFQPELLLSTQGAKNEFTQDLGDGDSYSETENINLFYLNIPLMGKFYLTDKISLEAGPQIGYLISAKNDYTQTQNTGGIITTYTENRDIKDELKPIDFGFNLGAGYDFTENLTGVLRFTYGLSDIGENGDDDIKINNTVLSLSVNYTIE